MSLAYVFSKNTLKKLKNCPYHKHFFFRNFNFFDQFQLENFKTKFSFAVRIVWIAILMEITWENCWLVIPHIWFFTPGMKGLKRDLVRCRNYLSNSHTKLYRACSSEWDMHMIAQLPQEVLSTSIVSNRNEVLSFMKQIAGSAVEESRSQIPRSQFPTSNNYDEPTHFYT